MVRACLYVFSLSLLVVELAYASDFTEKVEQLSQEANKAYREKEGRQKSEAKEQLKLLSFMLSENEKDTKAKDSNGSESDENTPQVIDGSNQDNDKDDPDSAPVPSEGNKTKDKGLTDEEAEAFLKAKKNGMTDEDALLLAKAKVIMAAQAEIDKQKEQERLAEEEKKRLAAEAEKAKFKNNTLLRKGIYIPTMTDGKTKNVGKFATFEQHINGFGVPMGTWVKASIRREVSSGDQGDIEIILEQDIDGKNKSIPAGTVIYASKTFNQNTRRLSLRGTKAVTPDGEEISNFITQGYDLKKVEGLDGIIERNREEVYKDSLWDATVEAAGNVVKDAIPSAASSVVSSVQNLEKSQGQAIPYVITVSPQSLYLRIERKI